MQAPPGGWRSPWGSVCTLFPGMKPEDLVPSLRSGISSALSVGPCLWDTILSHQARPCPSLSRPPGTRGLIHTSVSLGRAAVVRASCGLAQRCVEACGDSAFNMLLLSERLPVAGLPSSV